MSGTVPVLPYSAELWRKAIHLGALVLPALILVLGRERALMLLIPLAVVGVVWDVTRQRVPAVRRFTHGLFAFMMRPEEQPPPGAPLVLNGAAWMCLSAVLCALLLPEPVAAAALAMLMVGDGAAAVIGRRYGRHRYSFSPKSFEGSAAFFVTALLVGLPLALVSIGGHAPLSGAQVVAGAFAAAVFEALPIPLNDNIRVPVLTGLVMVLVGMV